MAQKLTTTKAVKFHGWTLPKGSEVEVLNLYIGEFATTVSVPHPHHEGAGLAVPVSALLAAFDLAEAGLIPTYSVDEMGRKVRVAA